MLFALFATAANGLLLGALWQGEEARLIRLVSEIAIVAVWLGGMASVLKLTVFTDREGLRKRRDEKIREGLTHYLRGELRQALEAFKAAHACDVDRADPDVLFHLGVVSGCLGHKARAQRYFRRCLAWDPARKWAPEIERELGRAPGPRPRPLPETRDATEEATT